MVGAFQRCKWEDPPPLCGRRVEARKVVRKTGDFILQVLEKNRSVAVDSKRKQKRSNEEVEGELAEKRWP